MKSKALQELRELALARSRALHPLLPEAARYVKPYKDTDANSLTHAIIDFLRFNGHQAERINCTGRFVDNTEVMTDVLGDSRTIGSVKWLPTSGQKGTADISSTIKNNNGIGISVKIEIKMRDSQSAFQKEYQRQVEAAGGLYWICHNFNEFIALYNSIT